MSNAAARAPFMFTLTSPEGGTYDRFFPTAEDREIARAAYGPGTYSYADRDAGGGWGPRYAPDVAPAISAEIAAEYPDADITPAEYLATSHATGEEISLESALIVEYVHEHLAYRVTVAIPAEDRVTVVWIDTAAMLGMCARLLGN